MNSGFGRLKRRGGVPEWLNGAVSKTRRAVLPLLWQNRAGSRENPPGAGSSPPPAGDLESGWTPPDTARSARASSARPAHGGGRRGARLSNSLLPDVTQGWFPVRSRRQARDADSSDTFSHTMPEVNEEMQGFEPGGAGSLPSPPVEVDDATRVRLQLVLASIALGATPEDVAAYLDGGFPDKVTDMLARPLEQQEMSDHVGVILSTLQAPALTSA